MGKKIKGTKAGITLIALVLTIIVMLILAGITINLTIGQDGIITRASESKGKLAEAEERESVSLAVLFSQMETATSTKKVTKANLEKGLRQELGNNAQFNIVENLNGSLIVEFNSGRKYFVDTDGSIVYNENMYAISSVAQLKAFRDDVNSGNTYEEKYVYLENDIDLNNEEWTPIGIVLPESIEAEEPTNKPFKGIFDGRGYEVDKIYINTTNRGQGLFCLVNNGKIINLSIGENSSITGGNGTGGVVGMVCNKSIIDACSNKGSVVGVKHTGGIVGFCKNTTIKNSYNEGNITGKNDEGINTGGVAGAIGEGVVSDSYNTGNITGYYNVAGIVGYSFSTGDNRIIQCYNKGLIKGNYVCGGIQGEGSQVSIKDCYNAENVIATNISEKGNSVVGGIIAMLKSGEIRNVYNISEVNGIKRIGGIVGLNRGNIINAYNVGMVIGEQQKGEIVGRNEISDISTGIIRNSYALDKDGVSLFGSNVSTITDECSLKSAEELKLMAGTLGSGFKNDENNINNGYPILSWQ